MFSLSVWSISALIGHIDVAALRERFSTRLPQRGIALYTIVIVTLNALIWLRGIVPTIFANGPPGFLDGTGVATNIVYIQDLGFWLPVMAAGAIWLYRRKPWGYLTSTCSSPTSPGHRYRFTFLAAACSTLSRSCRLRATARWALEHSPITGAWRLRP
jgi:hypothetical protein